MPLSPPTFTWHMELWFASHAMSPGQTPAHEACCERPVGAPSVVNSTLSLWFGMSENQTLPAKPTPQASSSELVENDLRTSPGVSGVATCLAPPTNMPRVVFALALKPFLTLRWSEFACTTVPP